MHGSGTILIIVVMVAVLVMMVRRSPLNTGDATSQESPGTRALGSEVKALKERLQVLERIAVDKENSLAREIEALADHDGDAVPVNESRQRSGRKIGR